ncbi:MAG TPA: L-lactate dehydrogenase [Novosphingobium sp.]
MSRAIASTADFRTLARGRLPHFLFEYYDGAAFDGVTARANERDLLDVELRQRVLCDVAEISTRVRLWDDDMALPLALSPVGLAGMAASRGEVQAARAAAAAGIPLSLSTTSVCRLDEVARVAPPWFQLYMVRDRGFVEALIGEAARQGCKTLLMTVDLPVLGTRWRDAHSGLWDRTAWGALRRGGQMLARPGWSFDVGFRGRPHNLGTIARFLGRDDTPLGDCMAFTNGNMEAKLDWTALQWVRDRWDGRLLVKGVLESDDAEAAIAGGADGIVVSNHGGRQLDGVASTACALPRIAAAVQGRVPLLVDGGVRSGLDVLRMLALGAQGVMIGRPWVFALAAAGERGVRQLIELISAELRIAMALTGCRDIAAIGPETIRRGID